MAELGLERELAQIGHAHREQDAVQVVDLVLDHAGVQAAGLALDRPAVGCQAPIADPGMARHDPAQTRDRKAAFEAELQGLVERLELGVDQGDRGAVRGVVPGLGVEEQDQSHRLVDLGRRQPDAVGIAHGLEHVTDQAPDRQGGRIFDRGRGPEQHRVPHAGNLEQRHGYDVGRIGGAGKTRSVKASLTAAGHARKRAGRSRWDAAALC